jgi:hypothetical protein
MVWTVADTAAGRWEAGQVRPREGTALALLGVLDQLRAELERDGGGR